MTVLFYRREGGADRPATDLPAGFVIRAWSPARQGLPPSGPWRAQNLLWWLLDRAGLFAQRSFTELSVGYEGRIVHRLIVTPRWYRFPFMAPGDLQIGGLWTAPDHRGRGLARTMVAEACRCFGADGTRLWYVVEGDNPASIRLADSCGFILLGRGRRTMPFGLRPAGRFRLDPPFA